MTKFEIIGKEVVEEGEDWRTEVQLCIVEEWNRPEIRICYYKYMKNEHGKRFWNLAPRSASFELHTTDKVIDAIKHMRALWDKTAKVIERTKSVS